MTDDLHDDIRRVADDIAARLDPDVAATVSADTELLYRAMPLGTLGLLKQAFLLDADQAETPHTRAFCESRVRLINRVLSERMRR